MLAKGAGSIIFYSQIEPGCEAPNDGVFSLILGWFIKETIGTGWSPKILSSSSLFRWASSKGVRD